MYLIERELAGLFTKNLVVTKTVVTTTIKDPKGLKYLSTLIYHLRDRILVNSYLSHLCFTLTFYCIMHI